MKSTTRISRRQFLARGASVLGVALATTTAMAAEPRRRRSKPMTIYRLSLRGRKGSKAAKRNCANLRFATPFEAGKHRTHPAERSRVVPLTVSREEYFRLFFRPTVTGGHRFVPVADLRKLKAEKPTR